MKQFRIKAGLSQQALAHASGISRQAYASLESGAATPSTEAALRLARALQTRVESLFSLADATPESVEAELLPTRQMMGQLPGQERQETGNGPRRVQLVRVGRRLFARPLRGQGAALHALVDAEGVLAGSGIENLVSVRPFDLDAVDTDSLVMLGCDPAAALLAGFFQRQGVRLVWSEEGSREALAGLARGEAHVAGCHLWDEATGTYNVTWVRRLVPFPCTIITFADWQQGLIVAPGNPKQIFGVNDLVRPEVSIINRQPGSGSRSLLDRKLDEEGVPASALPGYHRQVRGHLAVAEAVAAALVDAGIGIQAVATAMGLDFVPLDQERYDLVIPNHFLDERQVQMLLDLLRRPALRRRVETLDGYDIASMGNPPSE